MDKLPDLSGPGKGTGLSGHVFMDKEHINLDGGRYPLQHGKGGFAHGVQPSEKVYHGLSFSQ